MPNSYMPCKDEISCAVLKQIFFKMNSMTCPFVYLQSMSIVRQCIIRVRLPFYSITSTRKIFGDEISPE